MNFRQTYKPLLFLSGLFFFLSSCLPAQTPLAIKKYNSVSLGAQQFEQYLPKLKNKRVGVVTNMTGTINKTSIVDTLLQLKVAVKKVFGPEHGFRSDIEAGE